MNRFGGIQPVIGFQIIQRQRQARHDASPQRFQNHPGGERQNLFGAQSISLASASQVVWRAPARWRPCRHGVAVLINNARIGAAVLACARCSLQICTGAAQNGFGVNTPATVAAGAN